MVDKRCNNIIFFHLFFSSFPSSFPSDIEFNLTGNYGSPVHTNHNSNYSSMPSPDMEQSERKQQQHHDQSRRPLSVATDNMMLEFYKKDGYDAKRLHLLPTPLSLPRSLSRAYSPSPAHTSSHASDALKRSYPRQATRSAH